MNIPGDVAVYLKEGESVAECLYRNRKDLQNSILQCADLTKELYALREAHKDVQAEAYFLHDELTKEREEAA